MGALSAARLCRWVMLFCAGCGDSSPLYAPRDSREFYFDWYQIECQATRRCCRPDLDVQACTELRVAFFTALALTQLDREMAQGRIRFDETAAARCLAARLAAWQTCAEVREGPYAGCDAVFAGAAPIDAACEFDFCDDCLQPPLAVSECQVGSYCDAPGDPTVRPSGHYVGTCAPLSSDGPCTLDAACASGVCDGSCVPAPVRLHRWAC